MAEIHICRPASVTFRGVSMCPTCKRRRRFVVSQFVYYGPRETCCACGDSWEDGERSPRPCARGWRRQAALDAKRRYSAALPRTAANAAFAALLKEALDG